MGIREEIKKSLHNRLVLQIVANRNEENNCVICNRAFNSGEPLCIYAFDEGMVCDSCAESYAPKLLKAKKDCLGENAAEFCPESSLTSREKEEINLHLLKLQAITSDLIKGISRGITEAPASHIGLLYLLKDIPKPPPRENETEKDYDLRVKTHRTKHLSKKLKAEVNDRLERVQKLLEKL